MEVEEIKAKKHKLEEDLCALLLDFEKTTKTSISAAELIVILDSHTQSSFVAGINITVKI